MINTTLFGDAQATAKTLVPLKSFRSSYLEDLFNHVAVQTVQKDQVVFNSHTYDNQHVFLLSGHVELQYDSGYKEFVRARDTQLAIAHEQPRRCKAVTVTDSNFLRIDSDRLDRTLAWSQVTDYLLSELAIRRDLDEDIDWMKQLLSSNLFFKVPPVNAQHIFDKMESVTVNAGEVIIRQGEIGDCCYFIKEGDAEVTVHTIPKSETIKVADITVGRCFGEDALVNETIRNANIVMKSDGVLMRLDKSDFLVLLREPAVEEVSEKNLAQMADKPVFVDVRTSDEYALGHKAFSANIPLSLLSMKKRQLSTEKVYVFYCDSGIRSKAAAYLLGKEGFNVMALKGGIRENMKPDELVVETGYILRDGELIASQ